MDPITLAVIAGLTQVPAAAAGSAAAAGPVAAAVAPAIPAITAAATGAAATAPVWVPAAGTGLAAGSIGAGAAGAAGVASNPVAMQGAEATLRDFENQATINAANLHNGSAGAINDMTPPGVPEIPVLNLGY